MSFAWNLKTLRSEAELTQGELADRIGVSQKTLSSWETGRTDPTIADVIKLCKVFDCPIEKLTGTKTRKVGDITMEDVLIKMQSLSFDELTKVKDIATSILNQKKRLIELEKKKQEQIDRIKMYQAEIAKLEKEIGDLKK